MGYADGLLCRGTGPTKGATNDNVLESKSTINFLGDTNFLPVVYTPATTFTS
jgi:hypothetical protein